MNKINIQIEDKEYSVLVAVTEEEKTIGLSNTNDLNENEGMLFDYSDELPTELQFNTIDMKYPIDIIFINDEDKVTAVITGEPGSEEIQRVLSKGRVRASKSQSPKTGSRRLYVFGVGDGLQRVSM